MGCDAYDITVLQVQRTTGKDDWIELSREPRWYHGSADDSDDERGEEKAWQRWLYSETKEKILYTDGAWLSPYVQLKYEGSVPDMKTVLSVVKTTYRTARD